MSGQGYEIFVRGKWVTTSKPGIPEERVRQIVEETMAELGIQGSVVICQDPTPVPFQKRKRRSQEEIYGSDHKLPGK